MKLAGRTLWLTGASSGIGAAVAREAVARGAEVYGTARGRQALEELAADLDGFQAVPGDVTDEPAMRAIAEQVRQERGAIDIALFSAGVWKPVRLHDFSPEAFRASLDVNVMGTVHGIAAVLPAMRQRGRGVIAGVASVAGYRGLPNAAAYGATKAALINLLESLRIDAAKDGLKVVTVNPGFVDTPMTEVNRFPMPFLIDQARAARIICDGLERGRNEIVFPLPMAVATKAMRLLPVSVHAALFRRAGQTGPR